MKVTWNVLKKKKRKKVRSGWTSQEHSLHERAEMLLKPPDLTHPHHSSQQLCSHGAVVPRQRVAGTLSADILQTPPRMEADQKWIWEISDERQASLCLHGCWLKKKKKPYHKTWAHVGICWKGGKRGPGNMASRMDVSTEINKESRGLWKEGFMQDGETQWHEWTK